jgi:unsaturated rhamnogalacturonyl hydrolase
MEKSKRKNVLLVIIGLCLATFIQGQTKSSLTEIQIKADLDKVFDFLNSCTPAIIVDSETGTIITDYQDINLNSQLKTDRFKIISYSWGVTYSGMLRVAEVTGDQRYANYTFERFKTLGEAYPFFKEHNDKTGNSNLRKLISPKYLDDCGSIGAAMIKASLVNPDLAKTVRPIIDNAVDFIINEEYRMYNHVLARNRPEKNSVWVDDMYMGIPPIAYMAKLIENEDINLAKEYFNEAALQIELFKQILWVPEKNLFRHSWIQIMTEHPSFYWGRANAWATIAISDVLDVLPENHIDRNRIMELLLSHLRGLAILQSGEGFWHQLLDRNDSYYETSVTAMITYCMAHAINKGWVDPMVYGPLAQMGWNAVSTKINELGEVEGTCVGTAIAFYPAYYYNRPVSVNASHGYGPTLLAGAEMIEFLKNTK